MKKNQSLDKDTMFELENNSLIEKTATAIADGELLIDVRIDGTSMHYHPWLSELRREFSGLKEYLYAETLILDRAVILYARSGTLGYQERGFLENALNGNVKQFKKDINEYAVDLEYDDNHILTGFKIKLKDITVISIMNILS